MWFPPGSLPWHALAPWLTLHNSWPISIYCKCLFTCLPFLLHYIGSSTKVETTCILLTIISTVLISTPAAHSRNGSTCAGQKWMSKWGGFLSLFWSCIWVKLVGVKSFLVYSGLCGDLGRTATCLSFHSCLCLVCLKLSSSMKFCAVKYSNSPQR